MTDKQSMPPNLFFKSDAAAKLNTTIAAIDALLAAGKLQASYWGGEQVVFGPSLLSAMRELKAAE